MNWRFKFGVFGIATATAGCVSYQVSSGVYKIETASRPIAGSVVTQKFGIGGVFGRGIASLGLGYVRNDYAAMPGFDGVSRGLKTEGMYGNVHFGIPFGNGHSLYAGYGGEI